MGVSRDQEVAWAAGLFEGEGYISRPESRNQPSMELGSTDLDVLERFQRIVGCGAIHETNTRLTTHKQGYRWKIGGVPDVLRTIILLRPFMSARRGKAFDMARLQIQDCVNKSLNRQGGFRGATKQELQELLDTPWDLPWE